MGWRVRAEAWLWRPRSGSRAWPVLPLRLLVALTRDFLGGQVNLHAMSLVYTTLLSLVPVIAIGFSILKGFGIHNQIEPLLLAALEPLGERAPVIVSRIIDFVDNVQVGVLGFVGFLALFVTVLSLVQKIEGALNEVWQVQRERSLAARFRDFLGVIVFGPLFVFLVLGIVASLFASEFIQELRGFGPIALVIDELSRLLPLLLVIVGFAGAYKLIPNTRVAWVPALLGGLIAGLLWNLLGIAFARFVASTTSYTAIYSGFATPIFFMIWLYLGWLVLLLGASIAFYVQHPEYLRGRRLAANFSIIDRESVALSVLRLIGSRHYGNQPPVSLEGLAAALQLPPDAVATGLVGLQQSRLVVATDANPPALMPGRPWEAVPLAEVLEIVRCAHPDRSPAAAVVAAPGVVGRTQADIADATRLVLGPLTLKDFVMASDPSDGEDARLATGAEDEGREHVAT